MGEELPDVYGCSAAEHAALIVAFSNSTELADSLCQKIGAYVLTDTNEGLNTQFLLFAGALVFIMHGGFAMLCAGAIRSKNTMNILLQTILDAAVSALFFYMIGYGFAYGYNADASSTTAKFIGNAMFGLKDFAESTQPSLSTGRWTDWFFQWAFAATAATIPAGCVAERFNFNAYLIYTAVVSAWIYPVVVHWVWNGNGWLSAFNVVDPLFGVGMIDFAGCAVVHMVGGLTGMMGCILVGPRLGRFDSNGNPVEMPGHSATLVVLGTVLLWFGWYGFNPGSTLNISSASTYATSGRAACCTTLSGAAGCLTALALGFLRHRAWDLLAVCNGTLVGLVSVTASCAVVEPWAALLAGSVGVCIFEAVCTMFLKFQIDDPLAAAPMHGFGGAWGCIFAGLMAKQEYMAQAYAQEYHWGAFYPGGGGRLLACQIVGVITIAAWVMVQAGLLFFVLRKLNMLRIPPEEEQMGLDVSKHGGAAYNYDGGRK